MRKLIISIATAVTLVSVAGASTAPILFGETSVVAPTVTHPRQPAVPAREGGHLLRHAHLPLFFS